MERKPDGTLTGTVDELIEYERKTTTAKRDSIWPPTDVTPYMANGAAGRLILQMGEPIEQIYNSPPPPKTKITTWMRVQNRGYVRHQINDALMGE